MNLPRFELPGMVDRYLAVLNRLYERRDQSLLREIVVNGVVSIHEGWDYDNWDGGTYGHAITLTVPEDIFLRVFDNKDECERQIAEHINKLVHTQNEHVARVFVEVEPAQADRWREETGVYRPRMAPLSVSAEALKRIWGTERVRVFLSHKSSVRQNVSRLKQSLARCGIAAFVAHEDIEPTEEWQREIERALFSMDALVALLTEDYHESNWTDQEAGVAIGRGVPLIAVRLGLDPYGLMGRGQGLSGCVWEDTDNMAARVFQVLHKRLADNSRLFECALSAYATSTSFADSAWKVKQLLSIFDRLSETQVAHIVDACNTNNQNSHSFEGRDSLKPLLKKWTGRRWIVQVNSLMPADQVNRTADAEVPF